MASEDPLPAINAETRKLNLENEQVNMMQSEVSLQETNSSFIHHPVTDSQVEVYNTESKNLAEVPDDLIPEELLFSLTQSEVLLKQKKVNQLAPIKDLKSSEKLKTSRKGPPSNVWHYKERRTQFKHLIEHPRSLGKGVGTRDVSFLYDVAHKYEPAPPSVSKLDKSAVRFEATEDQSSSKMTLPDTVIPEEYHMVKTKSVLGLEFIDKKNTTLATDPEKTLRVFPSLKPNKRFEVIQLLQTLDLMLEQCGIHDDMIEVKGPTQVHNLLELIKKEQNIYDLVFSEVIRQVSIECVERGQLLSRLRQNYADLLSRIPRQIQSLHAEVMAQRSLDRRLTEELVRFKSSIAFLTKELQSVREHDQHVTMEAQSAEEELAKALKESQTNANLVDEYHSLYELQRKRLEATVADLTTERDLWSNAAYSLALKIATANSLNTAKRLHVSEKAWSKLADHFTVVLSDHDSECLAEMQKHVEKWRSTMFQFRQDLERSDKQTKDLLIDIQNGLRKWIQKFNDTLVENTADARYIKDPPPDFVDGLCEFFKDCEQQLGENGERFAGGTLLGNEEKISMMMSECEAWTEVAWIVYRRHRTEDDEPFPLSQNLKQVNSRFHELSKQLQIRFSGENGVAKEIMNLQNALDSWSSKLTLQSLGSDSVSDAEWLSLYEKLEDYINMANDTVNMVGSHQLDDDRVANLPHQHISEQEVMEKVHEWVKATVTQIEAEDGKLVAKVSSIHIDLVRWMVQLLLNLVPNYQKSTQGAVMEPSMTTTWSVEELLQKATEISQHLTSFTDHAWQCCSDLVQSTMQKKKDHGDDDADHEYRDFLRLKMEATEWIRNCEFLLKNIKPNLPTLFTNEVSSKLQLPKDEIEKQKTLPYARPTSKRSVNKKSSPDFEGARSSTPRLASDLGAESDTSGKSVHSLKSSQSRPATQGGGSIAVGERSSSDGRFASENQNKNLSPSSKPSPKVDSSGFSAAQLQETVRDEDPDNKETKENEGSSSSSKFPSAGKGGKGSKKTKTSKDAKSKKSSKALKQSEDEKTDSTDEVEAATTEDESEEPDKEKKEDGIENETKSVEALQDEEEESEPLPENDAVANTKNDEEEDVNVKDGVIQYNKLGHDENIHLATLEDSKDKDQDHLVRPTSGLMESAYDAIAKMDRLQHELLTTEIRAQDAEKKAIDLQEQLNSANEKIRALEKTVGTMQEKRESEVTTPQDKPDGSNPPSAKQSEERLDTPESQPRTPSGGVESAKRKATNKTKQKKATAAKKK